jgi:hypothetical protein
MAPKTLVKCFCLSSIATFAYGGSPACAETTQVPISPSCFDSFYGPDEAHGGNAHRPRLDHQPWDSARARYSVFKDPRTAIALYVESDGRHVAAINAQGALLWVSNPFEDSKLCPYRTPRPVIRDIEAYDVLSAYRDSFKTMGANPVHKFVKIAFDSSQFGLLDEANGHFYPMGQN